MIQLYLSEMNSSHHSRECTFIVEIYSAIASSSSSPIPQSLLIYPYESPANLTPALDFLVLEFEFSPKLP